MGTMALLAAPAIARARTWDSLGGTATRLHRGLWLPASDIELNPMGQLVGGLVMLLLFDAGSLRASRVQSKVQSNAPIFSFTGASQALSPAPTGGMALSTNGNSTDDLIASSLVLSAATNWTVSALVKFDGTAGGSGNECLTANTTAPIQYVGSGGTNLSIADSSGHNNTAITMASLSGWTRLTITETSASPSVIRTYLGGKLSNTLNSIGNNATMDFRSFINGWSFPTADIFLWNTVLSGSQIAAHAANPYGTVLRPRFSNPGLVGANNNCPPTRPETADFSVDYGPYMSSCAGGGKGSLMTTGVGR